MANHNEQATAEQTKLVESMSVEDLHRYALDEGIELDDEELAQVAGGGRWSDSPKDPCSKGGTHEPEKIYIPRIKYYVTKCKKCGAELKQA